jgi:hypothetical protein
MRINSSGNVGIGTTSPLVRLQLERTVSNATSRQAPVNLIYLTSDHPSLGYTGFGTAITHYSRTYQNGAKTEQSKIAFTQQGDSVSTAGSTIDFYTKTLSTGSAAPDLRMRINYNGNVGIGTSTPDDFDGESRNLVIRGGVNGSTPTIGMTIATDGNQASSGRCAIRFADGINGNERYRGAVEYNHNGDDMSFRTAGTQKMTLTDDGNLLITSGNVGIGTTSPWTKLAVSGTTASSSPSIGRYSSSTTAWTTILTFTAGTAYSVLLATSENNFSQMWRVSGSVNQQTCYYTLLGDSNHPHSKDAEFRISSSALQYKNINYSTGRVLYVFDVVQSTGTFTY